MNRKARRQGEKKVWIDYATLLKISHTLKDLDYVTSELKADEPEDQAMITQARQHLPELIPLLRKKAL